MAIAAALALANVVGPHPCQVRGYSVRLVAGYIVVTVCCVGVLQASSVLAFAASPQTTSDGRDIGMQLFLGVILGIGLTIVAMIVWVTWEENADS
jgi:hypothetical protein